jgi:hypothetical protein
VRKRIYPGKEHTVFMKEDELRKFKEKIGWKSSGPHSQTG